MKKALLLLSSFVGLNLSSSAQITVTPEVGFLNWKFDGYYQDFVTGHRVNDNYDWEISPRFGIAVDIPFGESGFSIEPGVYYTTRKFSTNDSIFTVVNETPYVTSTLISRFDYRWGNIEMPINLKYSWPIGRYSGKLFFHLSPYVSYNFLGKVEGNVKVSNNITGGISRDVDTTFKFGSDGGSGIKALDYGVYGGVGYQFQMGLQVRMFYGAGIANFSANDNRVLRHGGLFGVSVGYVLGRKIPGRFY